MIYFIRHGQSEANLKHFFAGQRDDCALTEKGKDQAQSEAKRILELGLRFDKIISSPLIRARDTANIVVKGIGYRDEIIVDPRISEYDMGRFTGVPTAGIDSKMLTSAPEAEDPELFCKRVQSFLDEYKSFDGNILIVCHGGVGGMIEAIRKGIKPALFYDLDIYENATVIKLDWLK